MSKATPQGLLVITLRCVLTSLIVGYLSSVLLMLSIIGLLNLGA